MRLLERDDAGGIRLTKDLPSDKIPPYAILSHTWGPDEEEVSYKDLEDGRAVSKLGYNKIQFCADQAGRDGLKLFWVDTCCINKSSSTELQEAINSMFRWYRDAAKCYVYLADISTHKRNVDGSFASEQTFLQCKWFTRGWTLQELIAPTIVEFFSKEGAYLGDKLTLGNDIHSVTGIPLEALRGTTLSNFSVEERMSWAKKRKTTRKEDKAYSLFGIFDVQMPLLYGEGEEKAFRRLREEINKVSKSIETYGEVDARCLSDLRSTDPRHDKKRIEDAKGGLLKDSYRWVLDNPEFQRWRDGDDQRLLWIKGDPGKGKTMLLCGIIDELEVSTPTSLLSFFFCQATDPRINSATAVLRGLVYILIKQQPTLISHVRQHYDPAGGRGFEDPNTWVVLCEILTSILQDPVVRIAYLFIDALDECVTDLPRLLKLIVEMSSTSSRVKWIVSSRNWTQIEEELEMAAQNARLSLELNAKSVAAAVNAYIRHKVDDLSRRKKYDTTTKSEVQDYLSLNANGTFLWVALVCKALTDVPKWRTKGKLKTFPPGLDSLYGRMMGRIQNSEDADLCRDILAVAATVRRPVSLDEITSLVRMPDGISDDRRSLEEIISLCGSFLTIREQTVYFVHQSAKDFLSGEVSNNNNYQDAFKWVFHAGKEKVNHDIFSKSLHIMSTVLRRDIYGLKAPGFSIDQVSVPNPDPLASVRYSCIYWIDHLCDLISSTNSKWVHLLQDNGDVQKFLTTKYLYWLEALSLLGALSNGINAVGQLQGLRGSNNNGQLKVIIQDAHRFAQSYGQIIQRAPLQVYLSALVFAPIGSLIKNIFKEEKPGWLSTGSVEMQWNACTQTLEGHRGPVRSVAFSPDGQRVASGSDDNTIKIWDAASGTCTQTLEGHRGPVWSVAFSPDGQRVASGSDDNTIKIWDAASGTCTQTLEGHRGPVWSVAFSPDGQRVASGSVDETIKIWDAASGTCTQTLEGHRGTVWSVAFSPDGQRVASGSVDKTIKIWDAASGTYTQTINIGSTTTHLSFDHTNTYITTNIGRIQIATATMEIPNQLGNPVYYSYGLGQNNRWITCNNKNVLWLPPEYHARAFAVQGRKMVLGCYSGRVVIFLFSRDI